jgi:hypothetical protein
VETDNPTSLVPPVIPAPAFVEMELPRREMMLEPLLTNRTQALIYGPRGLGKTFVAMGIARAVASGGSFLGWKARRPHRVLYIDGEMAVDEMKQRLLLFGPPPPLLDLMVSGLHRGTALDLANREGILDLVHHWGNPELVVLDNLSSLAGLRRGNPDRWHELQRFLITERKLGRAMLLVHHANKKGGQRGTSQREDALDLVMALRRPHDYRPREGARFEIHFEKARSLYGAETDPIEARLTSDGRGTARWHWKPARSAEIDSVATLLKSGLTGTQIARELSIPRARAYRLRARAIRMGLAPAA